MSTLLYLGHWALVVFVLGIYALFMISTTDCLASAASMTANDSKDLLFRQKESFIRRMKDDAKKMLRSMGWLMVLETITLVIFDSRPFIIIAMVCACLAASHFSQARRTLV